MVSLKLQKRLAASVLNCGARKIWMDPNEVRETASRPICSRLCRRSRIRPRVFYIPHCDAPGSKHSNPLILRFLGQRDRRRELATKYP